MAVSISKILDNSELSLKQFSEEAIKALEARIQEKDLGECNPDGRRSYRKV